MKSSPHREAIIARRLRAAVDEPPAAAMNRSQRRVEEWFAQTAPLIQWDRMNCPLGLLFVAASPQGVCAVDFGHSEADFFQRFERRARLKKNPQAVANAMAELREYFSGARKHFSVRVDLAALTTFQRRVLETACHIPVGQVWTYQQVAKEMARPKSSRPVGQALGRNPIPIIIPCHRVIASDGGLGGYSGGTGLKAKRWLLQHEGALS